MDDTVVRGKQQPQNAEAEASLLGAILIDTDAIVKIADAVSAGDFFEARHQRIFEAMMALYEKHSAIDTLTLSNQLKNNGYLDMVGGPAYLTELTNFVPTASHAEQYADIVAQKAMRRRLISTAQEMSQMGYDESLGLRELIEEAETKLFSVSQTQVKQDIISIEDILAQSFERLDDLHKDKQKLRGIPTGYKDLDSMLAGLQRSDLFVLAARPSMGKTAFVLNIAHNVAVQSKEPVLIFSLEMSKEQLVDRLLSMQSGVDAWALRTGNLTDADFEKIGEAMGVLSRPRFTSTIRRVLPSAVTITSAKGCTSDKAQFPAGAITIKIVNKDATAVSEAEMLSGERILGEKENIPPGFSGEFAVNVPAGSTSCTAQVRPPNAPR